MKALQSKLTISHLNKDKCPSIVIPVLIELYDLSMDILLHVRVFLVYFVAIRATSPCEEQKPAILQKDTDSELMLF
jgi:hypothetical protein